MCRLDPVWAGTLASKGRGRDHGGMPRASPQSDCGHENQESAKFCARCGRSLQVVRTIDEAIEALTDDPHESFFPAFDRLRQSMGPGVLGPTVGALAALIVVVVLVPLVLVRLFG